MYTFGGYVKGSKANDLWKFDLKSRVWIPLDKGDIDGGHMSTEIMKPTPRVGASLTFWKQQLYLFGGHDDNNEKINEFWKYDLSTNSWSKINQEGSIPLVKIYY